jgi:hypothetical protein
MVNVDVLGPWARSIMYALILMMIMMMIWRNADNLCSMGMSRMWGWHGYVDSHEGILQAMQQLAGLKMVPPTGGQLGRAVSCFGY